MRKSSSLTNKLTFNLRSKIYYSECKSVRTRYQTNEIKQREAAPSFFYKEINVRIT